MIRKIRIFFSADTMSAIFSLLIFLCLATMLVSHFAMGVRGWGLFWEMVLFAGGVNLVRVTYNENKKDYMRSKQV